MRNVLFLCTGNSARSILAEAILNAEGEGRYRAFSAGSHPTGVVNPLSVSVLARRGYDTQQCRSKSWDEFAGPGAPQIDFVFTVCDDAAGELCPVWPGHPLTAHWGISDPARVEGTPDVRTRAFEVAFDALAFRIRQFLEVPVHLLDAQTLRARLNQIGRGSRP